MSEAERAAPSIGYWHVWADADGMSHQSRCHIDEFVLESMQPPAEPQWQGRRMRGTTSTLISVLPVGWIGQWHENPRPQWIIPLAGRWFVETMDGTRVEMGPGEFSFGADQGCREREGRRGHLSGTVGTVPAVLMIVQLEDAQLPSGPCIWR
ncbi:MAG TPA: hypothetical protein VHY19_14575 [Steroidobacteraceae bacterium]|jgi:hypothetical protein|nr:hypothetical protein [Steroidobacteraceae bacterium]